MPTPNEIPAVSLIDRLQAENKKLKEENSALQKSIDKIELFNKILEREIAELKSPDREETPPPMNAPAEQKMPLPVIRVVFYAVAVLLTIGAMYTIASLFGSSKTSVPPPAETAARAVPPPPFKKDSIPPSSVALSRKGTFPRKDSVIRPFFLNDYHKAHDTVAAGNPNLGHYKVVTRAYLHNKPEAGAKSDLYINHLNKTVLDALDEKNGFIYIIFTNERGKTSRGWLLKKDLFEVSMNNSN